MRMTVRALVVVSVAQAFRPAFAQQNSEAIENFISVNAEVIALTHVRVIDGTGAAARDDQTIIVRDEAIAALLTLAQIHEQEISNNNQQMNIGFDRINARFEQVAATFQDLAKKSAETDERINALVNVVERYISKN